MRRRTATIIASLALFSSLTGSAAAHIRPGWLGWNHGKAAITQGGRHWLPGSDAHASGCRRLSYKTMSCTLVESGYAPVAGASQQPTASWSGTLDDIRATRTGPHRIVVWSPYWVGTLAIVR